jgi:dihydroxy-acid dehydratase
MLAGGLPIEFPTISIAESFSQPTSMYLRNLMSIDTEEMIRAQPMDAVVFENAEDLARRIDDPDLDVTADDILVLTQIGPLCAPGMPEAGYIPIPKKLARQGVKDMVRISDGRMSGTAAGTIVLHVTPEAAAGGPLAIVRNRDRIRLSVTQRTIALELDDAQIAARLAALAPRAIDPHERGYRKLFMQSITQADQGCEFDFLQAPQMMTIVPRG